VRDEVHLHESGQRIVPVGERANRNLASDGRDLAATLPWTGSAGRNQDPINRGRTDAKELLTNHLVKLEMAMTLQGADEEREKWPEAFPADSIGCLPENSQSLANRLIVKARSPNSTWIPDRSIAPKHPDRVLSVVSG